VVDIKARMFCPTHGKIEFDEVIIKNSVPICAKCRAELVFGNVKPRKLKAIKEKGKRKK